MLAHNVYFSLADNSDAETTKLIDACRKYLSGHDGTLFFAAGRRNPHLDRDVNDRDFDVALHVVFDGRESHDRYQSDERHLRFIEQHKSNWRRVRVFDSDVL